MTHSPDIRATTLRRLLALARDLLQAPDLKSVMALVGPTLQELLTTDGALLLVAMRDQEYVTEFDQHGFMQPAHKEAILYEQARQAIDNETPILLPEVAVDSKTPFGHSPSKQTISLFAFPFPPIKPVGVLAAFWHKREMPHQLAQHISTLRYISELAGAAIGNVAFRETLESQVQASTQEIVAAAREHADELKRRDSMEEETQRISITDVLTGMLNRRGFFLQAERNFQLARRRKIPSTLIFVDIDSLKDVNDALGHDVGDHLIQDCARILQSSFRNSDIIARLGGDEFVAFTFDLAQPQLILSRIQHNIESFHQNTSLPYQLSLSTGIVLCDPMSNLSLSDYLSLADEQMYAQKKTHK